MASFKPINAGFTLIEMMIVVAITAILAAVAMPGMERMIATQRAYNRADQLFSLFQFARAESIRTNQPVLICPTLIRQNAATSNGCVSFASYNNGDGWQGFMAFNDRNMDGSYTENVDSTVRVVAVNQNANNNLDIRVGRCNSSQNGCNNNINGNDVIGFMPNGQFGIGSGASNSTWAVGQSNVVIEIIDRRFNNINRRIVITPSGKPIACYGQNSNTNNPNCTAQLPS